MIKMKVKITYVHTPPKTYRILTLKIHRNPTPKTNQHPTHSETMY